MSDALTDALNSPVGRLAETLIKRMPSRDVDSHEWTSEILNRLNRLVDASGKIGFLARIRLAAEISMLYERIPEWTRERVVPLFAWSSQDATEAWSARKYSNYIGSPELFGLTKQAFLEMFGRIDVPTDDLRIYSEWLVIVLVANQRRRVDYPLNFVEARAALRRAGDKALPSVGHQLAIEMERAKPEEKVEEWRAIIKPIFEGIWPLDIELQSPRSTFKLVQILRASGKAFPEAAEVVVPFISPEGTESMSTVFSIAGAPDEMYSLAPERVLDLLLAVVSDSPPGSVYALDKALSRVILRDPSLRESRKYQKLFRMSAGNGG